MSVRPLPGPREATERWFIRRGLPSFVAAYSSDRDVWTRAVPFLAATFAVAVVLAVISATDGTGLLAALVAVAVLAAVYLLVNVARGRPALALPRRVGRPVLAAYAVVPALVVAAASRSLLEALPAVLVAVGLLAVAWVVTRLGVIPLLGWGIRWTFRQAGDLYRLATRALPLLLLVVTFLFVNTEVWQVAGSMPASVLWLSVGVFGLLGVLFIAGRVPEEVRGFDEAAGTAEVVRACAGTPMEPVAAGLEGLDRPVPLERSQRVNLVVVAVVSQLVQVMLFALVVWAFFVVFGGLAVSVAVQQAWLGDLAPVDVLWSWGQGRGVTREGLRVATFLGGFAGFYVTVYAATDAAYREHFFAGMGEQFERSLAVRRAYTALLAAEPGTAAR